MTVLHKWRLLCNYVEDKPVEVVHVPDSPVAYVDTVEYALENFIGTQEAKTEYDGTAKTDETQFMETFPDTIQIQPPRQASPDCQAEGINWADDSSVPGINWSCDIDEDLIALRNMMASAQEAAQDEALSSTEVPTSQNSEDMPSFRPEAQATANPKAKPSRKSVCVGFQ